MKKAEKQKDNKIRSGMQVEFICPNCGTHLAWALPDREMNCPKCGNWVTNANLKKPKLRKCHRKGADVQQRLDEGGGQNDKGRNDFPAEWYGNGR